MPQNYHDTCLDTQTKSTPPYPKRSQAKIQKLSRIHQTLNYSSVIKVLRRCSVYACVCFSKVMQFAKKTRKPILWTHWAVVVDSKSHLRGACGAFKGKMVTIRVLGNVSIMVWCSVDNYSCIRGVALACSSPLGNRWCSFSKHGWFNQ